VEPEIMRTRVQAAPVGRLGTLTADGRPHLVPCCFALVGDVAYSAVDHKPKASTALRRLANVQRDPRATLLVDHYDEDWSTLWWVRLDGRGRVLTSGPERAAAIDALAHKYSQYRGQTPVAAVLALDIDAWRAWP
jgi:PPOX class probable F420-dependent enzyme